MPKRPRKPHPKPQDGSQVPDGSPSETPSTDSFPEEPAFLADMLRKTKRSKLDKGPPTSSSTHHITEMDIDTDNDESDDPLTSDATQSGNNEEEDTDDDLLPSKSEARETAQNLLSGIQANINQLEKTLNIPHSSNEPWRPSFDKFIRSVNSKTNSPQRSTALDKFYRSLLLLNEYGTLSSVDHGEEIFKLTKAIGGLREGLIRQSEMEVVHGEDCVRREEEMRAEIEELRRENSGLRGRLARLESGSGR